MGKITIAVSEYLQHFRVLVVDDDPTNVALLEGVLEREGYTDVIGTTSPLEAPDLLGSMAPDIVLLDLGMPQMVGFEVLRKLGQSLPEQVKSALRRRNRQQDGSRALRPMASS